MPDARTHLSEADIPHKEEEALLIEEDIRALLHSGPGFRLTLRLLEQLGCARVCDFAPIPTAMKNLAEEWLDSIARVAPEQYLALMCRLRGLPPLTFKEIPL